MGVGKLVVFTGPSGVGKGTVEKGFINSKEFNFHFSVSATTRPKRENEIDGIDHLFLTKEKFEKWIAEEKFLEYVTYVGNYYGTLEKEVREKLIEGRNVFLEIELIGALKVIEKIPEAISLFLLPPSMEILSKRLMERKTESHEINKERIRISYEEVEFAQKSDIFKYMVINDKIDDCINEIIEIFRKEIVNV